jgi:hypothetical protein
MSDTLEREMLLAFAPVHKRAFGVAVGTAAGLAILLLTVASMLVEPGGRFGVHLLSAYFTGYSVTPAGALIGAAWGFFVGFIGGWFIAFVRNMIVAMWIFMVRTRAELSATRDFLDHI